MALNWDRFQRLRRENPIPKFALDKASKSLKKSPTDPYLLAWKASALLQIEGRASEALPILVGTCQRQPPITDLQLLSLIYSSILDASRQVHPDDLALVSVGADALKAWQNGAKVLPHRKARLQWWSALFVAAMKEECWEDAKLATVQANKEGIDPKFKKAVYYSRVMVSQLGGEHRITIAKATGKPDPIGQIQLDVTLRQMKEAYDSSPKPADESIQVSSMSDLRFMAAIYERQNRCAELFQLWNNPPPIVQKVLDGATWDFELLKIEVAQRQGEWQLVERTCHRLIDNIYKAGNTTDGNPTAARNAMIEFCTMGWTVWTSLLDAATHLYAGEESKSKVWELFTGIWNSLPPRDAKTCRAFGLTKLCAEAYCKGPTLESVIEFYFDCYRNPSCFKDLRRFVSALPVGEQKKFLDTIREHAKSLQKKASEITSEEGVQELLREWHEAEATVLKFEFLLIVSLAERPDVTMLEDFVRNALRLWRVQMDIEGPETMCASESVLVAIQALLELFEFTARPQYYYQAATIARYSLLLDKNCQSRNMALLSTRLHLRLGLGTLAFEHYGRVQVKEMLHDNIAWVALSRISQSHPFGANGSKKFSPDAELKKVITTFEKMESKVDEILYMDLQHFNYATAFDLLDLKRKLHTSLTKHFCIVERRRIARMVRMPMDATLAVPLRNSGDISDNCDWNALQGLNHSQAGGIRHSHFVWPVTKMSIYQFHSVTDIVSGLIYKETRTGQAYHKNTPLKKKFLELLSIVKREGHDYRNYFTQAELHLLNGFWNPIAAILHHVHPSDSLYTYPDMTLEEAFTIILGNLKSDENELRKSVAQAADPNFDRMPHLTEDRLNSIYGRLEVLRALKGLLDLVQPTLKRTNPGANEVSVKQCQQLIGSVFENYKLHLLCIEEIKSRLKKNGSIHIRAHIFFGKTGEAIDELIPDETLDWFSKEYSDSAIEALQGILKVQLV